MSEKDVVIDEASSWLPLFDHVQENETLLLCPLKPPTFPPSPTSLLDSSVLLRIVLCRQNAGNRDSKCENTVSDCFSGVNLTTTSTITRTQDPSIRASMDISSSIAIGILGLFLTKKIKRRLSHSSFLVLMFAHTISLHWILKSHT